jgi:CheY-like chemotaxis protein
MVGPWCGRNSARRRLIASEPNFDLVLADFAMPEMNGVELARALRTMHLNLPISS